MKIYIAFRYSRPSNVLDILANIGAAIEAGVEVAKKGHYPYIPHLDCLVAMWSKGSLPIEYYYASGMEWLKCCDAMLLLDESDLKINGGNNGVAREYQWAVENKMPIYKSVGEIPIGVFW